jgi:hypothetical protein
MNDKNLNMPANATHLGIKRDTSSKFGVKLVVPDRIQTARKTVYALMEAGLYGMNGINPMVSIHMIKCFVLPRLRCLSFIVHVHCVLSLIFNTHDFWSLIMYLCLLA